jgi:hypothetical protein
MRSRDFETASLARKSRVTLFGLFQMCERGFSVTCCQGCMVLIVIIDCLFEFFDCLLGVGIRVGDLSKPRVGERGLGVLAKEIGPRFLTMYDGFFGMGNGFGDMIFRSQRNLRHQEEAETEPQQCDDKSARHGSFLQLNFFFLTASFFAQKLTGNIWGANVKFPPLEILHIYFDESPRRAVASSGTFVAKRRQSIGLEIETWREIFRDADV